VRDLNVREFIHLMSKLEVAGTGIKTRVVTSSLAGKLMPILLSKRLSFLYVGLLILCHPQLSMFLRDISTFCTF
jgi:hypothetical protein